MQNFRIIVGLPSLNEADSIGRVTATVDDGLCSIFNPTDCLILNMDSCSDDGTDQVFLSTATRCLKHHINTGERGKGINLLELLRFSSGAGAEFVATIDSDLLTIDPSWVVNLFSPLIDGRCDYICPLYSRNRFEGSNTNHIALPVLYGVFNVVIRQPIGGEFSMTRRAVDYLLSQNIPLAAYKYGIDIFMTLNLLASGLKVGEVFLGRKFHKLSFPRIVPVCKQVSQTIADCLKPEMFRCRPSYVDLSCPYRAGTDNISVFPYKVQALSLLEEMATLFASRQADYEFFLGDSFPIINKRIGKSPPTFLSNEWGEVLFRFVSESVSPRSKNLKSCLGELIAPIFIWRVVSLWLEAEHMIAEEVENRIIDQAKSFRKRIVDSQQF